MGNVDEDYFARRRAFAALGHLEEARQAFSVAVQAEPNPYSFQQRAKTLLRLGRYEEALQDYDFILAEMPGNADANHDKGWTLFRMQRYEEALVQYEKAADLDPWNSGYSSDRARVARLVEERQ
ncbi:MAG: tetratricopeptide repeat protein [Hyphomicrobiales bacterium]|nr:tetratricopeptide repeat protein [Hyphomicrobiales bacterium]